jgi:hypothetical protein
MVKWLLLAQMREMGISHEAACPFTGDWQERARKNEAHWLMRMFRCQDSTSCQLRVKRFLVTFP